MALERWFIDDYELTGNGGGWEVREGTDEWAGMVGPDGNLEMRDGTFFRRKRLAAGTLTLSLWLRGANPTEVRTLWGNVLRQVARRHRMVQIKRTLHSGEQIYCHATVVGAVKPVHLGQRGVRASLTFSIPDGRWYADPVRTYSTAAGASSSRTLVMPEFSGSTAPMLLTYKVTGPVTSFALRDMSDGDVTNTDRSVFQFAAPLAAGEVLTIVPATWSITSSITSSPNMAAVSYTRNRFIELEPPMVGGQAQVRFDATGSGATTKLEVSGRKAYLT